MAAAIEECPAVQLSQLTYGSYCLVVVALVAVQDQVAPMSSAEAGAYHARVARLLTAQSLAAVESQAVQRAQHHHHHHRLQHRQTQGFAWRLTLGLHWLSALHPGLYAQEARAVSLVHTTLIACSASFPSADHAAEQPAALPPTQPAPRWTAALPLPHGLHPPLLVLSSALQSVLALSHFLLQEKNNTSFAITPSATLALSKR